MRGSITCLLGFDLAERDLTGVLRGGQDSLRVGRDSLVFGGFQKSENAYNLSITIPRFNLHNGVNFERSAEYNSMRILLSDDQGRRMHASSFVGFGGGSSASNERIQTFRSNPGPANSASAPARLVVQLAGRIEEVTVPFEFTDVPLP